jgi:Sigma-70 region 2
MKGSDIHKIWETYNASRSRADLARLVEAMVPLVEDIVKESKKALPKYIIADDLIQAGLVEVEKLAGRFDPSRRVLFSTFANSARFARKSSSRSRTPPRYFSRTAAISASIAAASYIGFGAGAAGAGVPVDSIWLRSAICSFRFAMIFIPSAGSRPAGK